MQSLPYTLEDDLISICDKTVLFLGGVMDIAHHLSKDI